MKKTVRTKCFGYPKIGTNRELKKALENCWSGKISNREFLDQAEELNFKRFEKQKESGIDLIVSNDFSLYDFILDLSIMFGVIPERFSGTDDELELYFSMARGNKKASACEMTKWFDTNYHYIVPEINDGFKLRKNRPLESYILAKEKLGMETVPNFVGAFTFLKLSKGYAKEEFKTLFFNLAEIYNKILKELEETGVKTVQLDEPALVLDLDEEEINILIEGYNILTQGLNNIDIHVQTYYESLSAYEKIINELPVQGIGLDFVVNNENLENIRKYGFPKNKKLIAGIVSGRDVWKTDYEAAVNLINELIEMTEQENLIISNSSPLFHLPVSLKSEKERLDKNLIRLLSFADERLEELNTLKAVINEGESIPVQNLEAIKEIFKNPDVLNATAKINEDELGRPETFEDRHEKQQEILNLPLFPTTTIGSYPQTSEVRKARADFKKGLISKEEYDRFIKNEIKKVIKLQEEIGLDVLVHGEFERTDMVEHFGQRLDGFAFTKNGWVQSYGSRCVRPPIIYGDVSRSEKMTIDEAVYAQSLTSKPVKGMLTGPVTILNWSFFRKDISKKETAFQIALALKDEVMDLEEADIKIIQIDEAAFREGLPLRKAKQSDYLDWAVKAFRITNEEVKPETQIHTHMCYSEFNEILESIYEMDSDVISIEASRSGGEIIEAFEKLNYDHGIGLGVYDIHSPRVPSVEEIKSITDRSIRVIDKKLFWINPDCGLKTRGYEETVTALKNMVFAANLAREVFSSNEVFS